MAKAKKQDNPIDAFSEEEVIAELKKFDPEYPTDPQEVYLSNIQISNFFGRAWFDFLTQNYWLRLGAEELARHSAEARVELEQLPKAISLQDYFQQVSRHIQMFIQIWNANLSHSRMEIVVSRLVAEGMVQFLGTEHPQGRLSRLRKDLKYKLRQRLLKETRVTRLQLKNERKLAALAREMEEIKAKTEKLKSKVQ